MIQYASEKAVDYKWFADLCLGYQTFGTKVIVDGSTTCLCKYTPEDALLYTYDSGGFAVHPRSDSFKTGVDTHQTKDSVFVGLPTETWADFSTPVPITTMFPLYDNDHGTMIVNGTEVDKNPDAENYGILSWTSPDLVITWRGWPNITIQTDRHTSVKGVTVVDVQTAYDTFYTPLASQIYVGGETIYTPGKVRGAGNSSLGYVVVTTVNYMQYDFVGIGDAQVNPDGGKGGYYDELWVQVGQGTYNTYGGVKEAGTLTNQDGNTISGWIRLAHRVSPISNTGVWFSTDGLTATEDAGTWNWSSNGTTLSANFVERVDTSKHEVVVTGTTHGHWSKTGDMTWQAMFMQSKWATTQYKVNDQSPQGIWYIKNTDTNGDINELVPVEYIKRPNPTSYYINITLLRKGVYSVSAVGFKAGPYTWSGGVVTLTDPYGTSAIIDASTVCGLTIIKVVDACGYTASVVKQGGLGGWSAAVYTCFCAPCTDFWLGPAYSVSNQAAANASGASTYTVVGVPDYGCPGITKCGRTWCRTDIFEEYRYTWSCL